MFKSSILILLFSAIASAEITKFTDAKAKDLDGKDVSFSKFENKCVLVIDTASGDTDGSIDIVRANMEYLNDLNEKYPLLEIIAFPSSSFGKEVKTNMELKKWFFDEWNAKYNVFGLSDFSQSDIYKFLKKQSYHGSDDNRNFVKFVVERDGLFVRKYHQYAGAISASLIEDHIKRCLST